MEENAQQGRRRLIYSAADGNERYSEMEALL
jgi:hypothetical protein